MIEKVYALIAQRPSTVQEIAAVLDVPRDKLGSILRKLKYDKRIVMILWPRDADLSHGCYALPLAERVAKLPQLTKWQPVGNPRKAGRQKAQIDEAEIKRLRAEGVSLDKLSEAFKVSINVVRRVLGMKYDYRSKT